MFELELYELSKIESLRLIHLFFCAATAFFLISLWKRTVAIDATHKKDIGLVLLAGAFLMWVFMDAYRFTGLMKPGESSLIIKTFSAYNNAFFLAALPFFDHAFVRLNFRPKIFQNRSRWALVVLALNIFLVMIYSFVWKDENDSGIVVNYIDLIYSIITYFLLGIALIFQSYSKSEMRFPLLVISIILSVSLVGVQLSFSPLFDVKHYDVISATAMISQVVLGMMLIALGYEWVLEVRTSLVSEQNRTQEKIDTYIRKNQELQSQLDDLQQKVSNERSISSLSVRELEILKHIHFSYSEMAEKLFISRDTVITHKKNIEVKLGVNGKKNLEEFAKSKGLRN
ncbi:MAG: response regulator transcription factor [Fluviicola sp.]